MIQLGGPGTIQEPHSVVKLFKDMKEVTVTKTQVPDAEMIVTPLLTPQKEGTSWEA